MSSELRGCPLPRFGIKWQGPENPIAVSMDDGYWTPWHIANDLLSRAPMELTDAQCWDLYVTMRKLDDAGHEYQTIANAARKLIAERRGG